MWVWCISGIELTGKTEVFGKTRPNATLFTTSPSWTNLGSKAGSEARVKPLRSWSGQHDWCWHLLCLKNSIIWQRAWPFLVQSLTNLCPQHGSCERTLSHRRPVSAGNLLSVLSQQLNLLSLIEEFEVPISSFCSELAPRKSISRQITRLLSWNMGSFF